MSTMPTMLKRALTGIPVLVLLLGLAACGEEDDGEDTRADDETSASDGTDGEAGGACEYVSDGTGSDVAPPPAAPAVSGTVEVSIETSVGDLDADLDADRTPCTVNSFVSLAEQGYFDGTSCHRLTTEGIFVLQCGDPTGTGAGGPGYSFADELDGSETYGPGTLAMANAGPNTNGSQFFIVYGDSPLPAAYTVFGTVDEESVASVEDVAALGSDNANGPGDGAPKKPVDISSVTVD